jgi:hypothetical protein
VVSRVAPLPSSGIINTLAYASREYRGELSPQLSFVSCFGALDVNDSFRAGNDDAPLGVAS